jgi:hypothetical protein
MHGGAPSQYKFPVGQTPIGCGAHADPDMAAGFCGASGGLNAVGAHRENSVHAEMDPTAFEVDGSSKRIIPKREAAAGGGAQGEPVRTA